MFLWSYAIVLVVLQQCTGSSAFKLPLPEYKYTYHNINASVNTRNWTPSELPKSNNEDSHSFDKMLNVNGTGGLRVANASENTEDDETLDLDEVVSGKPFQPLLSSHEILHRFPDLDNDSLGKETTKPRGVKRNSQLDGVSNSEAATVGKNKRADWRPGKNVTEPAGTINFLMVEENLTSEAVRPNYNTNNFSSESINATIFIEIGQDNLTQVETSMNDDSQSSVQNRTVNKSEVVYVNDSLEFVVKVNKSGMYVFEKNAHDNASDLTGDIDIGDETRLIITEEFSSRWKYGDYPLPKTRFQKQIVFEVDPEDQNSNKGGSHPPPAIPLKQPSRYQSNLHSMGSHQEIPAKETLFESDPETFGKEFIWLHRERKSDYLISIIVPVVVGATGAVMLVAAVYIFRYWRTKKEHVCHKQLTFSVQNSEQEVTGANNTDTSVLLLGNSSEDEC